MAKFIIEGQHPLKGTVRSQGAKNAATPILTATLLTNDKCLLRNVPRITDVENILKILQSLGSKIKWEDEHTITIFNRQVALTSLDKKLVSSMRSSILFIGPLLVRFKEFEIPEPGGCIIGARPIDTHLYALEKLGAKISRFNGYYKFERQDLDGSEIILPEFSVTATENVIMAASLAKGRTIVKLAAAEPHIQDLCVFLNKMGAKIKGIGTHTLIIDGVKKLSGTEHTIIPDQEEIGTLAVASALTKGKIEIKNIIPEYLEIILLKLSQIGVRFEIKKNSLFLNPSSELRSFTLQALPYPGFPTDLQAPFGVLATQCQGTSLIKDPLYEGRLGYIQELIKMGANAIIADPHRVIITGPTPLYGQEIRSLDLRAGASLVLAGLIARGQTTINEAQIIDRGYEKLDEKLNSLGARIKRIKD